MRGWVKNSKRNLSRQEMHRICRIRGYISPEPTAILGSEETLKAARELAGSEAINNYNNKTKNVSWEFDIGNGTVIASTENISLSPKEDVFVYVEYNYSDGDVYTVNATATSGNLSDSETLTVTVGDIIAYNMTELYNYSKERIFGFRILNNMLDLRVANWTLDTGGLVIDANTSANLPPGKELFVFVDYNYSSGGVFMVNATAMNGSIADSTKNIAVNVPD